MPLLALAACLLLAERPAERCGSDCGPYDCDAAGTCLTSCSSSLDCMAGASCDEGACVMDCVDEGCPGGFACDIVANACVTQCEYSIDCKDGYACDGATCVPECREGACDGGYACDYDGTCRDDCVLDDHCQDGWHCCDYGERGCDDGECARD